MIYLTKERLTNLKIFKLFFFVFMFICCNILAWICYVQKLQLKSKIVDYQNKTVTDEKLQMVLWWNHLSNFYHTVPDCGQHICQFTANRDLLNESKGVLFYGSKFRYDEVPLPRLPQQLWGLYFDESPQDNRYISSQIFLQHFNFTSTVSRFSDFPLLNIYMPNINDLIGHKYMKSFDQKSQKSLAPVLFLNSDCSTLSKRELYVQELMKFIKIDSYGSCLNNKKPISSQQDFHLDYYSSEQMHFLAKYKFVIAIENGVCNDYITEKFWRPLISGSIPIYFGSPTIRDWQPNNKSVIYVDEFENARALAKFLKKLANNETEYMSYMDHKFNKREPISNQRLKNELLISTHKKGSRAFECFLCNKLYELEDTQSHHANIKHYDCPMPPVHPPLMHNYESDIFDKNICRDQCQAQVLSELFHKNANYTKIQFNNLLHQRILDTHICKSNPKCVTNSSLYY